MSPQVTILLKEARDGRAGAADELMPIIYAQLRALAQSYLKSERPGIP